MKTQTKNILIAIVFAAVFLGGLVWLSRLPAGQANLPGGQAGLPPGSENANTAAGAYAGRLVPNERNYDFGQIKMSAGKVSRRFALKNAGTEIALMGRIYTSCMCTTAYIVRPDGSAKGPFGMPGHGGAVPPANESVGAGESRIIRVVYDPNAHGPAGVGRIDRFITLTDDSGTTLEYEIKANVTP